jgi:hypothetical protein
VDSFVDELPKAELHLHLVGSASVREADLAALAEGHSRDADDNRLNGP